MLTAIELASKLAGWFSLALSIILFLPEIVETLTKRPKELRVDTFVFYWSWLVGDGGQLIGLFLGGGLLTQKVLTISIAIADIIMIFLLSLFAGVFVCRPCRQRKTISALVASTSIPSHAHYAMTPPGWVSLGDELEDIFHRHGKHEYVDEEEQEKRRKKKSRMIQVGVLVIGLIVMFILWLALDFLPRETAEPDPVSSMPDDTIGTIAYAASWAGVPCWVGPRLLNIYRSRKWKEPEGITVDAVAIGSASHFCNCIAILLINRTVDSFLAQLPFLLTAVTCVCIDIYRLFLKRKFHGRRALVPPMADPNWLDQRNNSDEQAHDHEDSGSDEEKGLLRSRSEKKSDSATSSARKFGDSLPSRSRSRARADLADRTKHFQQAALLPHVLTADRRFDKRDPANKARLKQAKHTKHYLEEHNSGNVWRREIEEERKAALEGEEEFHRRFGRTRKEEWSEEERREAEEEAERLREEQHVEVELMEKLDRQLRAREMGTEERREALLRQREWEKEQDRDPGVRLLRELRRQREAMFPPNDHGLSSFLHDSGHSSTDYAAGLEVPKRRSSSRSRRE
ncbi:hypothetical protein JCM8547_000012 [Rhodosporidiobolus lusitaniae]